MTHPRCGLQDAEQNVARLLKAWQIPEEDVQWGETIAEGSFGNSVVLAHDVIV